MSDQKMRLYVDMDGTLAEFRPVNRLETLYEQGYFAYLKPHPNVVGAIRQIVREHPEVEVNVLSAYLSDSNYALQEKNLWLDRYLPEIRAEHRIFLPCGTDKKQYIPGGIRSTDVLLDDYTMNLSQWEPPARGLKLLNGINHTKKAWQGDRIRFDRKPAELAENIMAVLEGARHIYDENTNEEPIGMSPMLLKPGAEVFEQGISAPFDPDNPQRVIQGTIKFYDSKTQARRLLLVVGRTENQELICLGITSANPNKDHEKYVSTVPLPKTAENRLKYESHVKCDVEYIIAQDSVYADITPMPPRISNAEYNKVMAVYESLKRQSLVKRVQNTVEPKKDEFEKLRRKVIQEAEAYKRDPKIVAELVEFRARFYSYSINNVLLIRAQNRAATFVASYKDWKKHGYNVNRGEKGIKILVPYEVTYYRGKNGEWENVRTAPREILDKVYQGQIETWKQTYFTVGHVFDISQTTCPPADYPKFYDMGYESAGHAAVYECVKAFAERSGFQVIEDAISSIALKGFYKPADDTITINSRLADSEKLATITHEFAHALMHKTSTQPVAVVEFEAECLSHMILSRFGFPTSDVNKDYLATYYSKIKADELQLEKSFQRISKAYNHAVDGIDKTLAGRGIGIGLERQQKRQNERFVAPAEQVTQNFLQDIE